jgi:hypothetical protein
MVSHLVQPARPLSTASLTTVSTAAWRASSRTTVLTLLPTKMILHAGSCAIPSTGVARPRGAPEAVLDATGERLG